MFPIPFILEKVVNRCKEIYKQQGINGVLCILMAVLTLVVAYLQVTGEMK